MLTPEQLALRKSGISATDVVALSGTSPWRTAHDVYMDKVPPPAGPLVIEQEATTATELGHELEPIILRRLAAARNLVLRPGVTERHPTVPWALATPDADVMAYPSEQRVAVAEAKAVGTRLMSRWTEDVPDYVLIQVAWQMYVTRVEYAYVGALLGTELKYYEIQRIPDLEAALVTVADKFWHHHVLERKPPPPDGSASAQRMLTSAWPKITGHTIPAPGHAEEAARAFIEARAAREEATKREEIAKQQLQAAIADAEGMAGVNWSATWKWQPGGHVAAHDRRPARVFRFASSEKVKK